MTTKIEASDAGSREQTPRKKRRRIRKIIITSAVLGVVYGLFWFVGGHGILMAYLEGRAHARSDIRNGKAVLRVMSCYSSPGMDPETGLTVYGTGYPAEPMKTSYYVRGYNDQIRLHIRLNGLPWNSKKPWMGILFDLEKYWEEESRVRSPVVIIPNGEAIESRGCQISIVSEERTCNCCTGNMHFEASLLLRPTAGGQVFDRSVHLRGVRRIECLWGPPESGFAVLNYIIEDGTFMWALDTRTGMSLGTEPITFTP